LKGYKVVPPIRAKVVGVGGIGTWLVTAFANVLNVHAPDSSLTLYDGDNFEPKNKERQHFDTYGNKAVSVAKSLREAADKVFITGYPAWIVSDESAATAGDPEDEEQNITKIGASDLLEDGDVVILAVDNFACRKLIFDAAMDIDNIDIFSGGNGDVQAGDALFGSVYHFRRRNGECVTAHPAYYHPEFENPADRNPGELSCAERAKLEGGSQVVSSNMTVAAIILAKITSTILTTDQAQIDAAMAVGEIYFDWSVGLANNAQIWPENSESAKNADRVAVYTATV
jgi:hypothetical protein